MKPVYIMRSTPTKNNRSFKKSRYYYIYDKPDGYYYKLIREGDETLDNLYYGLSRLTKEWNTQVWTYDILTQDEWFLELL